MQTLDSSEDADLELMFAEIRRYPLLTADEEKVIDGKKWAAVAALSSVFAEVDDCAPRWQTCLPTRSNVRQR